MHEAIRHALWLNQTIGRELRLARLTSGKTQQEIASRLACSRSQISRRERGRVKTLAVVGLAKHAAVVGLRPSIRFFPVVRRPLDAAQLALLERMRRRASRWDWELEVPIPIAGDLRAVDARLSNSRGSIVVEAITRFADVQAQVRAAQLKRRDLKADRLILVLSATTANRAAVRSAGPLLNQAFPVGTWRALRALAEGSDPGGDALVLL